MADKILIRLPRKKVVDDREITLGQFEKHLVKDTSKSFSDAKATVSPEQLQEEPHRFSVGKEEYFTLDPDFLDRYKTIRRLAQIITLKDLGRIATLLGLTGDSVVVEAGSGSGAASCYFAKLVKEVHSYEVNDDHLAVARDNAKFLDCDNIVFHRQDVYENIEAHEADAFLLDVPDPSNALGSVVKSLRLGGRCVVYTPNLTQAQDAVLNLPEDLLYEGTIELTERQWNIKERVLRPRIGGIGHTAFLTLVRKVPDRKV